MKKTIYALIFSAVLFSSFNLYAIRPLRTDDAEITPYRKSGLETGLEFDVYARRDGNITSFTVPTKYTYGITRNWEAGFTVPILHYEGGPKNLGDISFHTKFLFDGSLLARQNRIALEGKIYVPTSSSSGDITSFNTIDEKFLRASLNLIFSQPYSRFKVYENIGYTALSNSSRVESVNILNAGIGLEKELNSAFSLVSELEGRSSNLPGYRNSLVTVFMGFRYFKTSDVVVDFGFGLGSGNGSPDFRSSAGVSYSF